MLWALLFVSQLSFSDEQIRSSFIELLNSFPSSIYLKNTKHSSSFEFCPDNTCDLIVSGKPISGANISDFGFLYLYYFSGYFVLENWRKNDVTQKIVEDVFVKHGRSVCMNSDRREMARCVLERAGLSIYTVRYDEGGRHLVKNQW